MSKGQIFIAVIPSLNRVFGELVGASQEGVQIVKPVTIDRLAADP